MFKRFLNRHWITMIVAIIVIPLIFIFLYNWIEKPGEEYKIKYFISGVIDEEALKEETIKVNNNYVVSVTSVKEDNKNYYDLLQTKGFLDADILIVNLKDIENYKDQYDANFFALDEAFNNLDVSSYQLLASNNHYYGLIISASSIWQSEADNQYVLVINKATQKSEATIKIIHQLLVDEYLK